MGAETQHAHDLIDRLPASQLSTVVRLVEFMLLDRVARAVATAPPDDEPVTEPRPRPHRSRSSMACRARGQGHSDRGCTRRLRSEGGRFSAAAAIMNVISLAACEFNRSDRGHARRSPRKIRRLQILWCDQKQVHRNWTIAVNRRHVRFSIARRATTAARSLP